MNNLHALQQIGSLIESESKEDRRLYSELVAGKITMEEYKERSPRYNSKVPELAKRLGIEL
jgi:hypothetical protein